MQYFGDTVFRTVIPRNVRLAEAPSFGKPVLLHDKDSRGALAYLALAGEMIRREEEDRRGRGGARQLRRHESEKRAFAGTRPRRPAGQGDVARVAGPAAAVPVDAAGRCCAADGSRGSGTPSGQDELAHLPLDDARSAASTSRASTCGRKRSKSSRSRSATRA